MWISGSKRVSNIELAICPLFVALILLTLINYLRMKWFEKFPCISFCLSWNENKETRKQGNKPKKQFNLWIGDISLDILFDFHLIRYVISFILMCCSLEPSVTAAASTASKCFVQHAFFLLYFQVCFTLRQRIYFSYKNKEKKN